MVESLVEICLENVCQNLYFNAQMIKLKNWQFHNVLCNWIYSKYIKSVKEIKEKDLEMFYFPFFKLTSLNIMGKFYDFPQFFLTIRIEELKEIDWIIEVKNHSMDYLTCFENLSKRNLNLQIMKLKFNFSFEILSDLISMPILLKSLKLISNCASRSTIELRIRFENFQAFKHLDHFKGYISLMEKCENLKILELSIHKPIYIDEDNLKRLNNLPFSSTLTELYIHFHIKTFKTFHNFFKQFQNLKIVIIKITDLIFYYENKDYYRRIFNRLFQSNMALEILDIQDKYFEKLDFISRS